MSNKPKAVKVTEDPKTTNEVAPSEELLTGVEGDENTTVTPVQPEAPAEGEPAGVGASEEVTPVAPEPEVPTAPEVSAAPSAAASEGSQIAAAIAQGMKEAKGDKTIKINIDRSVNSRFGVVKSKKTGEVMLRENGTGVLSKVQLESLEEKEASIQGEEVESVR